MANHTTITLDDPVTPGEVASQAMAIINWRFRGRFTLTDTNWSGSASAWTVEAAGTRTKTSEGLGFVFWLNSDRYSIEVRHITYNSWVRWIQDIFKHELAMAFGVKRFDGGDGEEETNPGQYKDSLYAFATRNMNEPLSESDREYVERNFTSHIPPGW